MIKLFQELKRRKVLTTLGVYAGVAFITLQVAEIVLPRLFFPDWAVTFVIVLVILGFPITFFLSWTYDLKREGSTSNNSGHEDAESNKKSKNVLLPITGFLTIIGIVFWAWYSLGSISRGSEMDNKIFKSIAVLYLDNMSANSKDDYICSALTTRITTALSSLGRFKVKARTDVLKFKNKIKSHKEIREILGVDAFIEGSLFKAPGNNKYIANVTLVDTETGNTIWAKEYAKTVEEIANISNTIASDVAQFLGGNDVGDLEMLNDLSGVDVSDESFSLLGKGINLLDSEKYDESVVVFDSILVKEPDNRLALFSKGQAFEGLEKYADAISKYEKVFPEDSHNERIKQILSLPGPAENYDCDWSFSDELNMGIFAFRNKNTNSSEISVIDFKNNEIVWKKSFSLEFLAFWIVGANLVITGSSISADETASIYVYDLQNRNLLMSKEFRKDYEDQMMLLTVMNDRAVNVPEHRNSIFLNIRRDEYYNIVLLDPINKIEKWQVEIPLNEDVQEGTPKIYVIESENKHYVFHQKGLNLYLFSAEHGGQVWTKTLSDDSDHVSVSFDRLISYSNSNTTITIQNIINQKIIGQFDLKANPDGMAGIINGNFIVNTKNSVTSLKTEKPFLRSLENWTLNIEPEDRIGRGDIIFSVANNMFIFTKSGILYCLNPDNGTVINKNQLDSDDSPVFIRDGTSKGFILYTNDFLIGLDPHNGKTLWKIREMGLDAGNEQIRLIDNQVVVLRRVNNQIVFKAYARSTGELLWSSNEILNAEIDCCNWHIHANKSNNMASIYLAISTGGLYSLNLSWNPNKHYIPKTDIYNHLAACYNKIGNEKKAEQLLIEVVDLFDQQNEKAFTQLSDMYLSNGNVKSFIDIQTKIYELVLYDNIKRGEVEGRLMEHAGLGWVRSFQKKHDFAIQIQDEKMLIAGTCGGWDDDDGCTISAFRKQTGIPLWKNNYNFSVAKNITPDKSGFSFIGMTYAPGFEGINRAVLYSVGAQRGSTILETEFWEGEERKYRPRKIYHFGTYYIIDADAPDYRHITAINSETGLVRWDLELDESPFLRAKEVDIVWSDSLVIIPQEGELQAYNLYSGNMSWLYDYTDDIDDIEYLNQSGVGGGAISFLSDDGGFVVLNIKTQKISYNEDVNFNDMVRIQYLDAKHILGYNNNGYIALFEKNASGVKSIWTRNVDKIEKLILSGKKGGNIHVLSPDNYSTINFQDGEISEDVPLIWRSDNIFIDNKYLGCFTGKKIYLINL